MKIIEEIECLNQMTLKMKNLVIENLKVAIDLYRNYDESKLDLINDNVVNLHERLIEEMCLNILVKERLYASDLRKVTGILKLITDLERLGDHAEDLAKYAKKLATVEHHECKILNEMIDLAFKMVDESFLAYEKNDIELANKVIKMDDTIDELYDKAIDKVVNHLDNNEYSNSFAIYTTLVIKYIERIADHAVNVSEWVIYIQLGYHKDKSIF